MMEPIGIIVGVCIVVCVVIFMKKRSTSNKSNTTSKIMDTSTGNEVNTMERQSLTEEKIQESSLEESGAKIYSFVNNLIKQMFCQYREETWDSFYTFKVSQEITDDDIKAVTSELGEKEKKLLTDLIECISIEEHHVKDGVKLKSVFESMILPFYPVYFAVFGENIRYTAFLNRLTLDLFHQLSGKKFRVGYRNKYANGVVSFSWEGDTYKVYDKSGRLLCDASFKDGQIYNGFGVELLEEAQDSDWKIERSGVWKDGIFQRGTMNYIYRKSCQ